MAVIHPLKHHAYYSLAGVLKSGQDAVGLFGYYNTGDFIDKILSKSRYRALIADYSYENISDNVKTSKIIKLLFLLAKKWPSVFDGLYYYFFQKWCISHLKNVDCIQVLQDYCNEVIRYAESKRIKIVYEQIVAFDIEQFITQKSDIDSQPKLLRQKENLIYADHILMASLFVKESILNCIPYPELEHKMEVIPYGAKTDQFQFRLRKYAEGEVLHILAVAAITKRKGIEYLIDAMGFLEDKPVHLELIGVPDADGEKMMSRISTMRNITHIRNVPHSEINKHYAVNDIFILPSLAEGSSLSVYEALASGMPCVVTPNVGSVITDGVDGYVVPPKDSMAIKNVLMLFLDKPYLVEMMSSRTRRTLCEYDWGAYEEKMAEFYRHHV